MRQRAVGLTLVLVLLGLAGPGIGRAAASEKIAWGNCPSHIVGKVTVPPGLVFECGRFQVPRDWDHRRAGPGIDIAVSRLRPVVGTALPVLFVNPGGPGAPGRHLPVEFIEWNQLDVARRFEIVGIDIRGVGGSTRFTCEGHTGERLPDGRTSEAVHRVYERLRARLVDHPGELNGEKVTGRDLDWLIIEGLGRGRKFQPVAEKMQALYYDVPYGPRPPPAEHQETAMNGDVQAAIYCNDTPSRGDRESLIANARRLGEAYPLLGWYNVYENGCVFWRRPALTMPVPTGEGVPPVLMVNSERDAPTPIEGARTPPPVSRAPAC